MAYPLRKSNPFLKMVSNAVYDNPVPPNLSVMWNFGSLLGLSWLIQVLTGVLLACYYTPDAGLAFDSLHYINREVPYGWVVQSIHSNGASLFFIFLYTHIGRGLYFQSYFLKKVWWTGCSIMLVSMAIAFSGYVLPWAQMSFWGATVITNLISVIPYVGESLVQWVWGGHSVCNATLKRVFVLHFLLPFLLIALIGVHLYFLHEEGSSNPLGVDTCHEQIHFHSLYTFKDLTGFIVALFVLMTVCYSFTDLFSDPFNFSEADPMSTPAHIQPEWYFLFAYTVLRSIPNKAGGVLAMVLYVVFIYAPPLVTKSMIQGLQFNPIGQFLFWCFSINFIFMSFIGACPVEHPFWEWGVLSAILHVVLFMLIVASTYFWDSLLEEVLCHKFDDAARDEDSEEEF